MSSPNEKEQKKPSRPPPPKLTPKPGKVKVVRALYKYTAQLADELSFEEGDLLYITDQASDPDWWMAATGDRKGLIPSNYVEESTEHIEAPLHDAAKRGNMSFMEECLKNQVSVNGLDKAGNTALHWAARGGHIQCVERLLKAPKVEINVPNKMGDTALHLASYKGHTDVIQILLDHGSNPRMTNRDGKMPIALAGNPATADILQKHMAKDRHSSNAASFDYEEYDADSD
ncbi:unnamed protein product [Darwinula stevensoni]|uniref:Osteoclast-stimulating factor 1 n=1 Tax=Darwinula stevensoni TaxID=69355 RepID=A0A7R9A273_9CRUS|nr:unnamed protein product [Darwinula stevensoni]CAG0878943.1 unnamed protein product [Darwinula stevensoni]